MVDLAALAALQTALDDARHALDALRVYAPLPMRFQEGDRVWLTVQQRARPATVIDASPNGKNLVLRFEGQAGAWQRQMTVLWTEAGWESLDGEGVRLEATPARPSRMP